MNHPIILLPNTTKMKMNDAKNTHTHTHTHTDNFQGL